MATIDQVKLPSGTVYDIQDKISSSKATNPNLLMNPWFTVNQRGWTTGASVQDAYCVDRWYMSHNAAGTVTVNSSGIKLTPASGKTLRIVQKFEDGKLGAYYAQSFDANGKIVVDLQKLVPGAIGAYPMNEDTVGIVDNNGYFYFYKGTKRVGTASDDFEITEKYAYRYDSNNQTLNVYDFDGKAVLNSENVISALRLYNDNIVYSVKPKTTTENPVTYASLYLFNTNTGENKLIGTNSETVTYEATGKFCYTVTTTNDSVTTTKTYFYYSSTVLNFDISDSDLIASGNNFETRTEYNLFSVEENETTVYYSVKITSPYTK